MEDEIEGRGVVSSSTRVELRVLCTLHDSSRAQTDGDATCWGRSNIGSGTMSNKLLPKGYNTYDVRERTRYR